MAKISRPVIYVALLGAVAYAAVVLTEPEKPVAKKVVRRTAAVADAPKGYTPEDLNAAFPRYAARTRDAFLPKVAASARSTAGATPGATKTEPAASLASGVWMLTGITSVNGVRTALLENGSAGESVFLKNGDIWNGLRVAAVEPSALVMVSPSGKRTRFGFPAFEEAASAPPLPALPAVPVPGVPGTAPGYTPVAPVILPPPPGFRGRRNNRSAAPQVAVPVPTESRPSPEATRSSLRNNQTNSLPDMLSNASGAVLTPGTPGAGQPNTNE
ncbi:MAG: hypothetical protein V4671_25375 [Armatimonadota bacterium]